MNDWGGRIHALCAGFGIGLILANLVPAPPGRWIVMVPVTVFSLVCGFVIPWFRSRWRVVPVKPPRAAGTE